MSVAPVTPILGSDPKDLGFVEELIAQQYRTFYPVVPYYVIKKTENRARLNIYGEVDYEDSNPETEYEPVRDQT
jgi:hypothetical protein